MVWNKKEKKKQKKKWKAGKLKWKDLIVGETHNQFIVKGEVEIQKKSKSEKG